jgi:Bacterial membrane protein YfhO
MPDPRSAWRRDVRLPALGGDAPALAGLFALVLALYGRPLLDGTVYFQRDVQLMWLSHARAFVEALRGGEWPTWNPWIAFGQPLWADANTQVLYPPTWLLLVLAPWRYYVLFVVGHLLLASAGTYALSRTLALSRTAAWVAAAVWVCSGPLASQVPVWNQLAGATWMPWTLLFALRAMRTWRVPWLLLWGGGHALQILAGAPEAALVTLAGIGAAALAMVLAAGPRMPQAAARALGAMAAAGAIALGLSAGQWIPSVDMARRSERSRLSEAMRTQWSVHPLGLAQTVVPVALPDVPLEPAQRRGVFESTDFVPSLYLGAAALGLGAVALAGPRRRLALWLLGGLAAAVAIALGRHAPFEHAATMLLPFLRSLRYPVKAMVAASFAASLGCGLGLDAWRAGAGGHRWRALFPLGAVAVVVLAVAVILGLAARGAFRWPTGEAFGVAAARAMVPPVAVALFAAVGVLLVAARAQPSPRAAALIGALVVGDLALAHARLNPTAPRALFTHRPPAATLVAGDAPQRLYVQDYFSGLAAPRLLGRPDPFAITRAPVGWSVPAARALALRLCLFPPSAGSWGLRGSFDRDTAALTPESLAQLTAAVTASADTPEQVALLRVGAVRHVLTLHEPPLGLLEPVGTVDCLLPAPGRIFRVPEPMPRAHVVGRAWPSDALTTLVDPAFDPRREVLLASADTAPLAAAGPFEGAASVVSEATTRVAVRAQASAPGFLVLADAYDPGWIATVDGQPAEVRRANVAFRAVAVPAGTHEVVLRYAPSAVRRGLLVSGLSGVLAVALLMATRGMRSPPAGV